MRRPVHQGGVERGVSRTTSVHPRFVDVPDAVALEHADQSRDVVFVRVRQHHDVDAAVPRRHDAVELREDAVGIGPAVDEHAGAVAALDEDRVPLADVEHDEPVRAADGVHRADE